MNKKKDIMINVLNHIFLKRNTHIELSVIRISLAFRTNKFKTPGKGEGARRSEISCLKGRAGSALSVTRFRDIS